MRARDESSPALSGLLREIAKVVNLEPTPVLDVYKSRGELRGRCPFHVVAVENQDDDVVTWEESTICENLFQATWNASCAALGVTPPAANSGFEVAQRRLRRRIEPEG